MTEKRYRLEWMSQIFVSKGGAYPSEVFYSASLWVALIANISIAWKKLSENKHASLCQSQLTKEKTIIKLPNTLYGY